MTLLLLFMTSWRVIVDTFGMRELQQGFRRYYKYDQAGLLCHHCRVPSQKYLRPLWLLKNAQRKADTGRRLLWLRVSSGG